MKDLRQTQSDRSRNGLTGAAFFLDGAYQSRLPANEMTCEMVWELVRHVPYMLDRVDDALCAGKEYGGVFDYEVSMEFGKWFAKFIMDNGGMPSIDACEQKMTAMVAEFFNQ